MENPAPSLRACSSCPGDYEDPDRTAWEPDSIDDNPGDPGPNLPDQIDWWIDEAGEA